jgi:hypothetical protein
VALVIGNSAYRYTSALANPKHDAMDMAAALRKHGFEVIEGLDLDKVAFDRKVAEFVMALKGSDAGVFFYAGHGLQVAGQNYLVPIDAKAEEAAALDLEMVRVETVHRIMERQTETNILFLDACRDNPLARNLARSMGTRSAEMGRGLARVEAGVGTLISFSTQPGNVALDGAGRNSPYTGALVKHLVAAKEDLSAILIDVRNDVMQETRNKQVPWEHVALRARFYFGAGGAPKGSGPAGLTTAPTGAAVEWAQVDKSSVAELETFRRRHPSSPEAEYALARIAALRRADEKKVAVVPPARPAPPPPQPPAPDAGLSQPPTAELQAPIDSLFAAWNTLDVRRYIAQWAPDGIQLNLKDGKRRSRADLVIYRERQFAQLQRADTFYTARLREYRGDSAIFDVSYSFALTFKSGRTFRENACETYRVERRNGKWLIVLNEDYAPCR